MGSTIFVPRKSPCSYAQSSASDESAYLEVLQTLRHHIGPDAVVVDDVATILGVVTHPARTSTLVVVLRSLFRRKLELPYPAA